MTLYYMKVLKENYKMKGMLLIIIFTLTSCDLFSGIHIIPPRYEVLIQTNRKYEIDFFVKNSGKQEIKVKIGISDWRKLMKGSKYNIGQPEWFDFPEKIKVVKPEEQTKFKIIFNLKKIEQNNPEFLTMICFDSITGSPVVGRLSIPVYTGIKGKVNPQAELKNFNYNFEKNKISFNYSLSNSGNVHIRPSGEIYLINKKEDFQLRIPIDFGDSLFSGETRLFTTRKYDIAELKSLNIKVLVDYSIYNQTKKLEINKTLKLKK